MCDKYVCTWMRMRTTVFVHECLSVHGVYIVYEYNVYVFACMCANYSITPSWP